MTKVKFAIAVFPTKSVAFALKTYVLILDGIGAEPVGTPERRPSWLSVMPCGNFWNVVPTYFKNVQTQVAMVTNTLQNFLASEKVQYGVALFVPQSIFTQKFNDHCMLNNLPNSIKFIQLPKNYNKPLLNIPINLKTIKCSKNYKFIDNLTNLNIEYY